MIRAHLCGAFTLACLVACNPDPAPVSPPAESALAPEPVAVEQPPSLSARELVDIHCVRCHLAPNPVDLSKENWPKALAKMSMYIGFKGDELSDFTLAPPDPDVADDSPAVETDYRFFVKIIDTEGVEHVVWGYKEFVLPEPLISVTDCQKIRDYFVDNAAPRADMYIQRPKNPPLESFTPTEPDLDIEPNGLVFATVVDEERRQIYVGRSVTEDWTVGDRPGFEGTDDLLALDLDTGERLGYLELHSDPIELELNETGIRVSTHGKHPFEKGNPQGFVADVAGLDKDEARVRMLAKGLHRTTLHRTHDMNGDGLDDIVVNTFGDGNLASYGGALRIYWQTPEYAALWEDAAEEIPQGPLKGALEETILVEHVGMISSAVGDFDDDGRPDIVALMAQGLQQLSVFVNKGDRTFDHQVIKQYTPSWGFNMVYTADMDGDGLTDIIAINGDNTDGHNIGRPSSVAKPKSYHGLRIFRNNGDLTFTEQYFYAMHGAIRAAIEDFDGDGDQDAAMIAMWPDWGFEEPETFVYLENQGNLEFKPASMPTENFGIWVSLESADVNADDKPDIILGLANWPSLVPDDWLSRPVMAGRNGEAPSVLYLINNQ